MKPRHKRTIGKGSGGLWPSWPCRGWFPAKLVIALALGFSLMFSGGGITMAVMAEDNGVLGIMPGIMAELQAEVEYVKGNAKNHTQCEVSFAVMSLTAETAEAVFEADLSPGESVDFKLEPGDYVILVIYTKDGALDGVVERAFRITDSPNEFGFDFRYGVPPVKA